MEKNKYKKWIIITILGMIVVSTILPGLFKWFFKGCWDWDSFLGSYVGGLLGGLGTLIAVYITTSQTRDVQNENMQQHKTDIEAETKKIITENALIIYYDLLFAFKDLAEFVKKFLVRETTEELIEERKKDFVNNKKLISNTYFPEDWIHTVAKISPEVDSEKLQLIYSLYGNFIAVLSYVNKPNEDIKMDDVKFVENLIEKNFYSKENILFTNRNNHFCSLQQWRSKFHANLTSLICRLNICQQTTVIYTMTIIAVVSHICIV